MAWQRVTGHELLRSLTIPTTGGRGEATTFVTAFRARKGPGTPTPGPGGSPGKREPTRRQPSSSRCSHAHERSSLRQDTVSARGIPVRDAEAGAEGKRRDADWRRTTSYCCVRQALYTAASLGVADIVGDEPVPVEVLAERVGADASALHRVMRLLASTGVFYLIMLVLLGGKERGPLRNRPRYLRWGAESKQPQRPGRARPILKHP